MTNEVEVQQERPKIHKINWRSGQCKPPSDFLGKRKDSDDSDDNDHEKTDREKMKKTRATINYVLQEGKKEEAFYSKSSPVTVAKKNKWKVCSNIDQPTRAIKKRTLQKSQNRTQAAQTKERPAKKSRTISGESKAPDISTTPTLKMFR